MSIDLSHALSEGLDRSLKRNGVILFVVFLVLGVVNRVMMQSALDVFFTQAIQWLQEMSQQPLPSILIQSQGSSSPLSMSIPFWVAIALLSMVAVLGQAVNVLSDRTFISDETKQLHEPRRWIIRATLSSIGALIAIFVLTVLLSVPIVLLAAVSPLLSLLWSLIAIVTLFVLSISFFFFRQEIASRNIGPIDALTDSWSLVKGDRFKVFGLAVLLSIISFVGTAVGGSLFGLFSLKAGTIAGIVIGAAFLVFDSAVAAQVYRQLCAEKRDTNAIGIGNTDRTDTTIDEDGDTDEDDEWEPDDKWDDPPL
jgi:MFS family permease